MGSCKQLRIVVLKFKEASAKPCVSKVMRQRDRTSINNCRWSKLSDENLIVLLTYTSVKIYY